jgi:hypothetical protein
MIPSYAHVFTLGRKEIRDLFADPVVIEEKIDGSQFSFAKLDGELYCRSRKKEQIPEAPDKMFEDACRVCLSRLGLLNEGWIYRGEYLQKPKHNALAYDRHPANHIILWDIEAPGQDYLSPKLKRLEAARLGLEAVPVLYKGIATLETVLGLMETVSVLGGQKVEGLVVKNYHRLGEDKKILCGKHVSEAFKEVQRSSWKKVNPGGKDILGQICERLKTEARWNKAIQHLTEENRLEQSPKDIGPLIKEVQADTLGECEEDIKEWLLAWAKPHIRRAIVRGLPEWYKDKLLEAQFQ